MPIDYPISLHRWVSDWLSTSFSLVRLAGDGSSRQFFRLSTDKKESFILLYDPDWKLSQDYPVHQEFLYSKGLAVPKFLKTDITLGILVMEDLGDDSLQSQIMLEPENKKAWLEKSLLILADLHGKTFPVPKYIPATQRFFDAQKYREELEFTQLHLSETLLGFPALDEEAKTARQSFCDSIGMYQPLVFCHRDYHSRNIFVKNRHLYLIDFQDARLGSPAYDLVSILYDAYLPLNETLREELFQVYKKQLSQYDVAKQINWNTFKVEMKKVAFQRVVKAAGSFASFYNRYQKTTHLPYLSQALTMAQSLAVEADLSDLLIAFPIKRWLDEWNRKKIV